MKTQSFQNKLDLLINRLLLWAIPKKVTPNMLTYLRFASIPLLFYLFINNHTNIGIIVFALSAFTDTLDGVMARTRDQITSLGKALDPLADKALIATMLTFFGFEYLIIKIFLFFILLEAIVVAAGSYFSFKFGKPLGANTYGKIKMLLQTISISLFLIGLVTKQEKLIVYAEYILFVALFFAVLAGIEVTRRKWPKIKEVLLT